MTTRRKAGRTTVLASDLGGTRIKTGILRDGAMVATSTMPAHSEQGLAAQLPVLKAAWHKLLAASGIPRSDCAGAVMAFPSLVDPLTGAILAEYGKYADAPNLDLHSWAHAELDLPLAIENDARLALVGEWERGAGRGIDNLAMITLGTGLGTAAIIEGRLLRGRHGQAGVLGGHSTVRYAGRPCSCGNVGCAEAEASTAFLGEVAAGMPDWETSSLRSLAELNYAAVFSHAAAGDPGALQLRGHSLIVWSSLAVNLIHAYDPEILILGGGIMASADVILPFVRDYVDRHAHTPWGKVRVVESELGDESALVAGDWLLRERFPDLLP